MLLGAGPDSSMKSSIIPEIICLLFLHSWDRCAVYACDDAPCSESLLFLGKNDSSVVSAPTTKMVCNTTKWTAYDQLIVYVHCDGQAELSNTASYCKRLLDESGYVPCRHVNFWPAKQFSIHSNGSLKYPIEFTYDCFGPVNNGDVFDIEVAMSPPTCVSHYLVYTPAIKSIGQQNPQNFSPMLVLNRNNPSNVMIGFGDIPSNLSIDEVAISLDRIVDKFDVNGEKIVLERVRQSRSVLNTGYGVGCLINGNYRIRVIAVSDKCKGACTAESKLSFSITNSTKCPKSSGKYRISSYAALIAGVIIAFVLLIAFGVGMFIYCERRRSKAPPILTNPKVVLLYTHDHDNHSQACHALALYLQNVAKCQVIIDVDQPPSANWLFEMEEADYVITVFSSLNRCYFDRPRTHQPIPVPHIDIFESGIRYILNVLSNRRLFDIRRHWNRWKDIGNNGRSESDKFVCVCWDYKRIGDMVPSVLTTARCPTFTLPSKLRKLVTFLHLAEVEGRSLFQNSFYENLVENVAHSNEFECANPNWVDQKLRAVDRGSLSVSTVQNGGDAIPLEPTNIEFPVLRPDGNNIDDANEGEFSELLGVN